MSSPKEEKGDRVEIKDLPRNQEELKDEESKNIEGGGSKPTGSTGSNSSSTDPEPFGSKPGASSGIGT